MAKPERRNARPTSTILRSTERIEEALVLEHHRDRIVGRPVDADLLGLVGRTADGRRRQGGGGKSKNATSGKQGHDDFQRETAPASLHAHTIG
jgi:hypothetical protein